MTFANGHALVVGIGTYVDTSKDAPPTAADAERIAAALSDDGVAGYPADQVMVLRDGGAKLEHITAELDRLATTVTADDTVVIFYAGHGLPDANGEYHLTSHDSQFVDDDTIVSGTGLSETQLLASLEKINAEKLLLVVNACFSGNIGALGGDDDDGGAIGAPPSQNLSTRVLGTGEGRAVITACRATQQSWFLRTGPTTIFGQAVADGLRGKGAAANATFIGLFDFYQYVFTTTMDTAAALKRPKEQEPVISLTQGVGPFPVALTPAAEAGALGGDGMTDEIQSTLPSGAVEEVPLAEIEAAREVQPGMDFSRATFNSVVIRDVGGDVNMEDVVFGGQVKITIEAGARPADAAAARTTDDVKSSIAAVRAQLDTVKAAIPADRRDASDGVDDVQTELDRATTALDEGNSKRVLEKLEAARARLARLGPSVPAAVALSETVAVLTQKARSAS